MVAVHSSLMAPRRVLGAALKRANRLSKSLMGYVQFVRDIHCYSRMAGAAPMQLKNVRPMLADKEMAFDAHYFYQAAWSFRRIYARKIALHVDIGSDIRFIGLLSAVCRVTFIDIRPLDTELAGIDYLCGSVLSLPFKSGSVQSLSCLHVLEHIGLGRYGDPLDPLGTQKGASELVRVLAEGGELYVSLPVGRPRLCFNAHRIHTAEQVLEYFGELQSVEISWVDDRGHYHADGDLVAMRNSTYACGLFRFRRV